MTKVCHILHEDGPGGGPVIIIDQLSAMKGRVELSVIHGGRGKIAAYCEQEDILHWQVAIDRKSTLLAGFFELLSALRQAAPDVVILHGQWAGPIGALALKFTGIKRCIYSAGWPSFYADWDWKRVLRNWFSEAIPCHYADRVVVLSQGSWYQYSIRKLAAGKLRVIHNCVATFRIPSQERFREVRQLEGWDDRFVHVVSVGRLADQKCVDWLLRSWRLVQDQRSDARLWIIGDGPEEAALHQLARDLGITGTCTFLGVRPNGIEYIGAGDITAMTTLYEGHSITSLEALACGRPMVINDVDGTRDSLNDGVEGFLVPPADIETFASRLLQLIRDPELRQRMGAAGPARAQEFSVEKCAQKHLDLIAEVMAEPKTK